MLRVLSAFACIFMQASASSSASNLLELEELNRKLARSEEDLLLFQKRLEKAEGKKLVHLRLI